MKLEEEHDEGFLRGVTDQIHGVTEELKDVEKRVRALIDNADVVTQLQSEVAILRYSRDSWRKEAKELREANKDCVEKPVWLTLPEQEGHWWKSYQGRVTLVSVFHNDAKGGLCVAAPMHLSLVEPEDDVFWLYVRKPTAPIPEVRNGNET